MITKKKLEDDLFTFFDTLFSVDRKDFGFFYDEENPLKSDGCFLAERQNQAIRPADKTLLYFRIDDYEDWGGKRVGTGHYYTQDNTEVVTQLKTFTCIVNILSKIEGAAYDASNFLVAMAQSQRYEQMINEGKLTIHLKQVSEPRDLTILENSTWVERIETRFVFNFVNEVENKEIQYSVHTPSSMGDVVNSVDYTNTLKEGQ